MGDPITPQEPVAPLPDDQVRHEGPTLEIDPTAVEASMTIREGTWKNQVTEVEPLRAKPGFTFRSGKTYTHSQGLSCCFRQWRATDSHCQYLHGYALQVELVFRGPLDDRNWVVNFGGLKGIKAWLEKTFDHKTLVARDDPMWDSFVEDNRIGKIQLVGVEHVGCEAFAQMIYHEVENWLSIDYPEVLLESATVREHGSNWASYGTI